MEYVPIVKDWTEDKSHFVSEYAQMCIAREEFVVYAKPLEQCVKLFPKWDQDRYLLGMPGDYLVVSADDLTNIFIEPGDNFMERYQEI
jgi:phosphoglycolate phosphatase